MLVESPTVADARVDGLHLLISLWQHLPAHVAGTQSYLPSPTFSPTDPVPRGQLWPTGLYTAYIQPIYGLYTADIQPIYSRYTAYTAERTMR